MIIPIRADPDSGIVDWAMIEMQGSIDLQDSRLTFDNMAVATMGLATTGKETVHMTVGYHQLEGKKVPLKKPVAVMEKVVMEGEEQGETPQVMYKVVGVIRNKYLFKTRPRALISKPR